MKLRGEIATFAKPKTVRQKLAIDMNLNLNILRKVVI
jgi:hypothetical protein